MHFAAGLVLMLAQGASVTATPAAAPAPQERFAAAGITDAEAAGFLRGLQLAVKTRDADAVASLTIFPLTVRGSQAPLMPLSLRNTSPRFSMRRYAQPFLVRRSIASLRTGEGS